MYESHTLWSRPAVTKHMEFAHNMIQKILTSTWFFMITSKPYMRGTRVNQLAIPNINQDIIGLWKIIYRYCDNIIIINLASSILLSNFNHIFVE